jgi:hypothetical protein
MAPIDGRRIVGSRFGFYPVSAIQPAKETALVAFVADSRAERFHSDQQRVAIAIGRDFFYNQSMTGSFAFEPQFIARSAKERDVARFVDANKKARLEDRRAVVSVQIMIRMPPIAGRSDDGGDGRA